MREVHEECISKFVVSSLGKRVYLVPFSSTLVIGLLGFSERWGPKVGFFCCVVDPFKNMEKKEKEEGRIDGLESQEVCGYEPKNRD